jgi:septal ring factor EnvC (AmiA/AmiB activator)
MDLERAMEFMLEQQARFQEQQGKFQEQQGKFQERQAKFDEQHAKLQENLAAHDERLAKAERLLIRGAESLAIHREAMQETDRRITALVLSQEDLRANLNAFIDSMRKSGNGH